jgi:phospholipid/cholesterol/gamma-HCH transport system ATP-binding protein
MDTPNGKPVILIKKLHKSFGNQTVLNGVDLEVAHGKTLMILGRSGMGKSVLLKLIIGLQTPDSGSIQVDGKEIVGLSMDQLNEIRKRIGFLFQNAALYDSLTVAENVAFPLKRHTEMSVAEQKARVHELLSRVGMEEAGEKKPAEISGGMRKRVGLARALALNPEIMLSDEPTAGLDPITAGEINDLIRELKQERQMSSIVVTHDMHSAKTVSDSVALLDKGEIVIGGTFDDLEKSNNPFVSEFLKQSF